MARYRTKSPEDLSWNRTRRRITRSLDTHIMDWREVALDKLLDLAFDKFVAAVERGEVKEFEAEYESLIDAILTDLTVPRELQGALEDGS